MVPKHLLYRLQQISIYAVNVRCWRRGAEEEGGSDFNSNDVDSEELPITLL